MHVYLVGQRHNHRYIAGISERKIVPLLKAHVESVSRQNPIKPKSSENAKPCTLSQKQGISGGERKEDACDHYCDRYCDHYCDHTVTAAVTISVTTL